jgi:hypothetical protein
MPGLAQTTPSPDGGLRMGAQVKLRLDAQEPFAFVSEPGALMTDMDYPLYPEGIYLALKVGDEPDTHTHNT